MYQIPPLPQAHHFSLGVLVKDGTRPVLKLSENLINFQSVLFFLKAKNNHVIYLRFVLAFSKLHPPQIIPNPEVLLPHEGGTLDTPPDGEELVVQLQQGDGPELVHLGDGVHLGAEPRGPRLITSNQLQSIKLAVQDL